ncbi:hypothetical protein MMC18_000353 [Xylographa bjoerkii]|nr:hypothetical protein [Xylographa bjoerkii]
MPSISVLVLAAFAIAATAIASCNNPGPAFPAPRLLANSSQLASVKVKLDTIVANSLIGDNQPAWNSSTTSFALQLTSAEETLWSSYYTAPILGDYKDSNATAVTGDTVFRAASITKSFTVYALLLENSINLEDKITKYLPELDDGREDVWHAQFSQITIRSLASQLSGISRETALNDLAVDRTKTQDPIADGFPPVPADDLGPYLIGVAKNRTSIFSTNDRSTYSNVAFSLLGLVLEKATGKPYSDVITSFILKPLGMDNSSFLKPKDSQGIIPFGSFDWAVEEGADRPAVTNEWMKPHSWSISGVNSAFGMPWEILRTTKLTSDRRAIDIITKGGGMASYFSNIVLIPEFDIGITVLVAGDYKAKKDLTERIIAGVVPMIEDIARNDVRQELAGFYGQHDHEFGPLNANFSIKLEVDNVGPGMKIAYWVSNGTDFLKVYGRLKGMPVDPNAWEARLLPTRSRHEDKRAGQGTSEIWRVMAVEKRRAEYNATILDDLCITDVDVLMYGGQALEEFIFMRQKESNTVAVLVSGLRSYLVKGEESVEGGTKVWKVQQHDGMIVQS